MWDALVAVQIEELPEGGFLATSEDVPGLVVQGRTVAETLEIAQHVARRLVESYLEHGDELPPALNEPAGPKMELCIPVAVRSSPAPGAR